MERILVEFKGKWYLFYHDCVPSDGKTYLRSMKMSELEYAEEHQEEGEDEDRDGTGDGAEESESRPKPTGPVPGDDPADGRAQEEAQGEGRADDEQGPGQGVGHVIVDRSPGVHHRDPEIPVQQSTVITCCLLQDGFVRIVIVLQHDLSVRFVERKTLGAGQVSSLVFKHITGHAPKEQEGDER